MDPAGQVYQIEVENAAGARTLVGEAQSIRDASGRAPAGLLESGEYVGVELTALHPQRQGWKRPATFMFRRSASGWMLVDVERE
jgi:hypothetical protein